MAGSDPGDYTQWERGNVRGTRRGRFLGSVPDPATGENVDVYSIADNEFDGTIGLYSEHLMYHGSRRDPTCVYCGSKTWP